MRQLLWSSPLVLLMACASTGRVVAPEGAPSMDGAPSSEAAPSGATSREGEASAALSPEARKQQASQLLGEADRLMEQEDYDGAHALYQRAERLGARFRLYDLYNAACAAALADRVGASVDWLRKAIDVGFEDLPHLQSDTDLDAIRRHPGYAEQVARLETVRAGQDGPLREELLRMRDEDQALRHALTPEVRRDPERREALRERIMETDAKNTARLKAILAEGGWPTHSRVGKRAARAAWMLAQHADRDPAFQREVLVLMETAVDQGESEAELLAYLTDRVLLSQGKPQRYGTQYTLFEEKLRPRPVEDMERLHALRAEAGMDTLEEYLSFAASHEGLNYSLEPAPLSTLTRP